MGLSTAEIPHPRYPTSPIFATKNPSCKGFIRKRRVFSLDFLVHRRILWCGSYYFLTFIRMDFLRKIGYGAVALGVSAQQTLAAGADMFGGNKVQSNIKGREDGVDTAVQDLIANVMLFLGIIAVVFGLYGGFLILTAGGKDDNVKKGKTILIQAGMGLVVIFLANSVVQFILNSILT